MKNLLFLLSICSLFMLTSCDKGLENGHLTKGDITYTTYMEGVLVDYWNNTNGTWSTFEYNYKYRLVKTGTLHNAVKSSEFVVLSNTKYITFQQCANQILSSNTSDFFDKSQTLLVEMH